MDPNLPFQPPAPVEPVQPIVPAMPPMESVSVAPTPVPPPTKKTNWVLILGIVLLLISVLALVGYFVYQNYQSRINVSTPLASPEPTAEAGTATPDPTADWKIYTNKTYGISFNYPKEAKIIGDIESQLFTIVSGNQSVSFLASKNSQDYSVNEFMLRTISPNNPDSVRKYVTFSNVSFNNLNFVLANQDANYFSQQSGSLNSYLIGKGNYVFSFGFNKVSESLITQILSTFQFTNTQSTSSATPTATPI